MFEIQVIVDDNVNVTRDPFTSPLWSLWAIDSKPDTGRGIVINDLSPRQAGLSMSRVDRRRPEGERGAISGYGQGKARLS